MLLFLLFGLATAKEVLDTSGEPLVPGAEYYILPRIFAIGGGLSLAKTRNKSCPVDVIQEISEVENGMPLKITPIPRIGIVTTGILLKVSFTSTPNCTQSSEWMLVKDDSSWLVGIGGPEDHSGSETLTGWFKIEEYEKAYKLMFCPIFTAPICGDIGIYVDEDYNRHLILSDQGPYVVVFRKANETSDE
ncbi:hypothetical protein L6164_006286 [Bauhinia variegata]|nr:hypothetical protein L6164_006286 [Bauhinia variegata]